MCLTQSAKSILNSALSYSWSYSAPIPEALQTQSLPNLVQINVHIYSLSGRVMHAFILLAAVIFRAFRDVIVSAICTYSLDITLAYVTAAAVMYPPATRLVFSGNFHLSIKCHMTLDKLVSDGWLSTEVLSCNMSNST